MRPRRGKPGMMPEFSVPPPSDLPPRWAAFSPGRCFFNPHQQNAEPRWERDFRSAVLLDDIHKTFVGFCS